MTRFESGNPIVSICCLTYNHKQHLRKALDSFLMQQAEFAFEVLIHDDASTDGTTEIIKEYEQKYPLIFKPIYQAENQWSKGFRALSSTYNFPRAKGKYIAMCEGDDYWTDPYKLQKQVDFMERHPECSMVFTGFEVHKSNGEKRIYTYNVEELITPDDYLNIGYYAATLSMMLKREVADIPNEGWMINASAGDLVIRYKALTLGDIGTIPDVTCVYNQGNQGSWTKRKLNKRLILKEFSDHLRALYFLNRNRPLAKTTIEGKVRDSKKAVYYKMALSKGKFKGFFYLVANFRKASLFYLAAFIKGMVRPL